MSDYDCPEFWDEIPFKEGRMYDPRNSNFWKRENRNFGYKIVISVKKKIRNLFSRSRMMKWIALLESSCEI